MKTQDIKNMARALQQVQEKKLTGNQHKLDMDKDGDIDAKDFAHMRKKKKSGKEEVTMNAKVDADKGAATEEQKEDTNWPIYKKIMEKRDMHTKGATEPEAIDSKDSPGGKKMKADVMQGAKMDDTEEKGHDDVVAAGRVTKTAPSRNADNKAGDKTIVNPPEDITKKAGMKA